MVADQSATFNDATATSEEVSRFAACKWCYLKALSFDKRLKLRDKAVGTHVVMVYIHKWGNAAYPGFERLAADLNVSLSTIERSMRQLVRCDFLIPGHTGGGRGLANEYTVDWSQYDKPQTPSEVTPFRAETQETPSNQSVNPVKSAVKTPSNLTPQKSKSKRVLKEGRSAKGKGAAASPLSARKAAGGSPSSTGGSGKAKKGSQHGNGASIPKPRPGLRRLTKEPTTAAKRIERKLISECKMGKVEAWRILIDVSPSEAERIAARLGKLSGSALLVELSALTA